MRVSRAGIGIYNVDDNVIGTSTFLFFRVLCTRFVDDRCIVGVFCENGTIFSKFPDYFIASKENRILAFFYSSMLMIFRSENKVKRTHFYLTLEPSIHIMTA